jgi:ribosomal protein S18 acetylase RimI-like enzyme
MSKTEYSIRDYRPADFSGIYNLWIATGMTSPQRGDNEASIAETLKIGGKFLVMQDRSGMIIGTSWMTYDGRRIHLHHFGIHPDFQGRGHSKALLRESLVFVKEKGCQVKLEVHNTNKKAINLYAGAGFKRLGDFDVYIIRDLSEIDNFLHRFERGGIK